EFAPLWIRNSKHCRLEDGWMRVKNRLNFTGVNILASGDNHVLQAVKNEEVTIRILIADVSSAKHTVAERPRSFLGIIPIAAHDIGAPSHQFALLTCVNLLA